MSGIIPLGGLTELVRELDARIQRHPTYADASNLRGLARACTGNAEGALADLRAALERNPNYQEARLNLGWLHCVRGELEPLQRLCAEPAARALDASHRAQLQVLEALCAQGPGAALEVVERWAPAAAPAGVEWLELDRLWLLLDVGRERAVERQLARILAWRPGAAASFQAVGLLRSGADGSAARTAWGGSFRGNPCVGTVVREYARIRAQGDAGLTWQQLLHWSVALSLDLGGYWMAVGAQHDLDGHDAEAEVAFRRAIDADPGSAHPHIKLGLLYASVGSPQEARVELERAAQLAPRYADVRYQLALVHDELGALDRAEAQFRAALDIHPDYALARLALGCLLESQRRDAEALPFLEGVRAAGVASADVESRLAAMYERLGRAAEARHARAQAQKLAAGQD
jgi:tetratricopeptide (TPR) repeat protein